MVGILKGISQRLAEANIVALGQVTECFGADMEHTVDLEGLRTACPVQSEGCEIRQVLVASYPRIEAYVFSPDPLQVLEGIE